MGDLQHGVNKLLQASISANTAATYNTAIKVFKQFLHKFNFPLIMPINIQHIVLFISYCFEKGHTPNTVNTYVAGINYFHKLSGFPDISESFLVKKMLEGCSRLRRQKDIRLPITNAVLRDICTVLPRICYSQYESKMFKAAFLLAFYGLFRIGELVAPSNMHEDKTLMFSNVSVNMREKKVNVTLKVTKTNQSGPSTILKIPCEQDKKVCPVSAVYEFCSVRPKGDGPFFCHTNGSPVTRYQFSSVLAKCIRRVRPGCSNIKSHSFRIGRATQLFALGVSTEKIKSLGRWKSDAYKTYIRAATN